MLNGDGDYNLNVMKESVNINFTNPFHTSFLQEIKVTESFLGLKEEVRGCQNLETFEDCTTRNFLESLRKKCDCIPFALGANYQAYFDTYDY